ncbi:MAG: hypothetical protein WC279_09450 [Sulfurimonas sp.]|jgi:hypothetical protein|uniref:hypothetical protein n=1 Tax=unclassified Sulfurimonas TaxID=2623549 RepID=UPI0008B1D52C|nr:hypothetical protein [Sulfurimonas sp. RIFOXYB12_FULL_35_9]MBS4068064.1 DUF3037 domain-containing protein [Sulfurimonas sp.]MDX9757233.1 hypothetical protein [Sulfurimonas sp.]OHE06125.1 MAG: hypothetical protein A2345_06265 [Sulfurimonas sp. RIFOXYB12_FULL_35_9]
MEIPRMKNYPKGEYSLIQISPTIDSQELINIGVMLRDFTDNIPKIRLFDDMKKLLSRVHIDNIDSLEYGLDVLKKTVYKNNEDLIYKNFTNSIKINSPMPISITESTVEKQLEKLFYEKITLLKTFPADGRNTVNNILDKNHIISNINDFIKLKNLDNTIKIRKQMNTTLGISKLIDAIGYNQNGAPIIVSDIISPATSKIDEMYAKSLFTLNNLVDKTIKKKIFYIPTMDGIEKERLEQVEHIKAHIRGEGLIINDSKDPKEFIESIVKDLQVHTA